MNGSRFEAGSFPPWSRIPSLQDMCREAGIGHDQLIDAIAQGLSTEEAARRLKVKKETIDSLYEHFYRYGISSVQGGD
ncbi:MAG: helix-turn-helix domain-containing protein [Syntrophomonadaceae bacterium]|jgi:hypothetical protein|nr:helix-turn-helix domain-containing protein [Syntrophomonadaceae bacterium]